MTPTARGTRAALGAWLSRAVRRQLHYTCAVTVDSVLDVPDTLAPRAAALVRPAGLVPQWLAFDCPCRDRHRLLINLSPSRTPHWNVTLAANGAISLTPSVDAFTEAGRCHFWLKQGSIRWVPAHRPRRREGNR